MGAERVNQIEYDVSNNIKVNLKTGRLLFTYNIINLFKDEYNLSLNLIYNHKNELNPNMNTLLGSFFRLDINEYIQRTGNLIYYIDSLDRYNLSETYYENSTEIHKHFNDESGLTLIVNKNDDNIIRLKDDFGNEKEFTRQSNQSENTYYYVLTKKTVKYNNTTSISCFYNYDSNNRLISMYNSVSQDRVINFKYNDIGLLSHIYINYNNKINGVRLKYNSNFELIAIKKITNSIEEIGYILRYSNNLVDALVDYKLKEVYTFEYDVNNKLEKVKKGYINLTIKEENNKYASETTYTSDLLIDNYVKNDEELYVIRDIDIITNKNIIFTYNANNSNTIVKKEVSNNDEMNISYIYYYDAFGRSTTTFEYSTNNNLIYFKNTNACKGIELLGSSNQTYEQNNNLLINNLKPYQFEDCLGNIQVSQAKINAFNNYHTKNINNCNDAKIIYNVSANLKINQIYKNNKLVFEVTYEDNSFQLIEKKINIVKTDEWFNNVCAIELEKKRVSSIFAYITSDNDYNKYSISNMYIYLGSKSIEEISYLDSNNQRQLVLLENQEELKYIKVGSTQEESITLNNSGSEYYNYLSFTDLILTYYNYLRSNDSFDLVYSSSNYSKKRIKVKLLKIKFNLLSYASLSNIEIINESYNNFTNYINQKILKYESVALPTGNPINLLCNDTKVSVTISNQLVEKHAFTYFDLNLNNILSINEDGLKTYIEYDNYNRVMSQSLYNSENNLLQSSSKTYNESCDTEISILGRSESHYNNFGLLSSLKNSGIDNNPYIINYQNNELNKLNCISDNSGNRKNLIRYNDKGLVVEEFNKDQNNISNHFYEYDNYNRLFNCYRLDELRKNSNTPYNINYSYNNHTNTVTKRTRINDNTIEESKYKYDRNGNLESVYENNDLKVVYNYDYFNKIESINDFLNNIDYNYTYDENNNVSNIISYDQNLDLNRYSIDFDNYGYEINLYDDTITNKNKTIYNDNLINKKVKKVYSKYHTSDYTYNNMNSIQSIQTIYANDNYGIENYRTIKTNNYKVINGVTTNLIDSATLEAKVSNYLLDKFTLSNSYNSKLNMVSGYTLLKEKNVNNTLVFSNKYRHDFEYNNSLEVSKDKVSKYNSNNAIIEYKETNYTYDSLGNIISINKKYGNSPQSISIDRTNVYAYNNGLLDRITSFDNSYRTFTYDYYGNTTSIKYYNSSNLLTKEEEFTYSFDKLIRYKVYNSNRVIIKDYSYIYDHNNIRIKKINILNNSITDYIVYDNNILYSDGLLFIYNGSELIGFNYNDKTYSYVKDVTGNILAIIKDGEEVVRYIYDSYGNTQVYGYDNNGELEVNNSDSFIGNINPFRYKSYYLDKESGLYYLNSRYYNSEVGRFISPDDISYLDNKTINGLNLYCYCVNNPVMYADPEGQSAILIGLIIGAIIGACIGFGAATYIDYQDDGEIFNGSVAWYDYAGATILGGAVGAAIGAGIVYLAPQIAGALSSFAAQEFTIGAGTYVAATGELVMSAGVTFTGSQVIGAVGIIGATYMFVKGGLPNNKYQNKQWAEAMRRLGIKDKDLWRRLHDASHKYPYQDNLKDLLELLREILKKWGILK